VYKLTHTTFPTTKKLILKPSTHPRNHKHEATAYSLEMGKSGLRVLLQHRTRQASKKEQKKDQSDTRNGPKGRRWGSKPGSTKNDNRESAMSSRTLRLWEKAGHQNPENPERTRTNPRVGYSDFIDCVRVLCRVLETTVASSRKQILRRVGGVPSPVRRNAITRKGPAIGIRKTSDKFA